MLDDVKIILIKYVLMLGIIVLGKVLNLREVFSVVQVLENAEMEHEIKVA